MDFVNLVTLTCVPNIYYDVGTFMLLGAGMESAATFMSTEQFCSRNQMVGTHYRTSCGRINPARVNPEHVNKSKDTYCSGMQTTAHVSISVHIYFVTGKFATAQVATSKIKVIFSLNFNFLNSSQLNFMQHISPSCFRNAFPGVYRPEAHVAAMYYLNTLSHIPDYCVINFYRL